MSNRCLVKCGWTDPDKATSFLVPRRLAGCTYPESDYADCTGCLSDVDADGICDEDETGGCTDANCVQLRCLCHRRRRQLFYSSRTCRLSWKPWPTTRQGCLRVQHYRVYAELANPQTSWMPFMVRCHRACRLSRRVVDVATSQSLGAGVTHVTEEQLSLDPTLAYDSYVALGEDRRNARASVDVLGFWRVFRAGFPH